MNIQMIQITDIKPYANNPRKNAGAVDAVANSIKEFGFRQPIVVDKNYEIVAGHTRYLAAQKLGLPEVPCVIADDLTPEQIKAFRLADNKTHELSDWDFDLLNVELDGIFDIDMSDFGFDFPYDNKTNETRNTSGELPLSNFGDDTFAHECPKCGFKFNDE